MVVEKVSVIISKKFLNNLEKNVFLRIGKIYEHEYFIIRISRQKRR